jgi:hypothetical protein
MLPPKQIESLTGSFNEPNERDKQKALEDIISRHPSISEILPGLKSEVIKILETDLNRKKMLKTTNYSNQKDLGIILAKETSIGSRLQKAIMFLEKDNMQMKNMLRIQDIRNK